MEINYNALNSFVTKLKRIGVEVRLSGNYPWIYLDEVNGNRVKDRYLANHGFTIAWYPKKEGEGIQLTDIKKIFEVVRKYR